MICFEFSVSNMSNIGTNPTFLCVFHIIFPYILCKFVTIFMFLSNFLHRKNPTTSIPACDTFVCRHGIPAKMQYRQSSTAPVSALPCLFPPSCVWRVLSPLSGIPQCRLHTDCRPGHPWTQLPGNSPRSRPHTPRTAFSKAH